LELVEGDVQLTKYKLNVLRIFVTDWERALQFYTETLGIPTTYRSDEMGWAQLDTGDGQLALERVAPDDEEGNSLVGRFLGVSLEVDDIRELHRKLEKRGVHFTCPPVDQAWGGTLSHFEDPDGNVLTLLGSSEQ
jgi:predicted enzyme related to lactoylglutathione lyase